jgi:hypothetical protein
MNILYALIPIGFAGLILFLVGLYFAEKEREEHQKFWDRVRGKSHDEKGSDGAAGKPR